MLKHQFWLNQGIKLAKLRREWTCDPIDWSIVKVIIIKFKNCQNHNWNLLKY